MSLAIRERFDRQRRDDRLFLSFTQQAVAFAIRRRFIRPLHHRVAFLKTETGTFCHLMLHRVLDENNSLPSFLFATVQDQESKEMVEQLGFGRANNDHFPFMDVSVVDLDPRTVVRPENGTLRALRTAITAEFAAWNRYYLSLSNEAPDAAPITQSCRIHRAFIGCFPEDGGLLGWHVMDLLSTMRPLLEPRGMVMLRWRADGTMSIGPHVAFVVSCSQHQRTGEDALDAEDFRGVKLATFQTYVKLEEDLTYCLQYRNMGFAPISMVRESGDMLRKCSDGYADDENVWGIQDADELRTLKRRGRGHKDIVRQMISRYRQFPGQADGEVERLIQRVLGGASPNTVHPVTCKRIFDEYVLRCNRYAWEWIDDEEAAGRKVQFAFAAKIVILERESWNER